MAAYLTRRNTERGPENINVRSEFDLVVVDYRLLGQAGERVALAAPFAPDLCAENHLADVPGEWVALEPGRHRIRHGWHL